MTAGGSDPPEETNAHDRRPMALTRGLLALIAPAVAAAGLAACGSGGHPVSAPVLLARAKATADATPAVHFALTSSNVSTSGTNIVGGSGDLVRPNSLQGSFSVAISGFTASVKVVSVGNVFEAQLPFAGGYKKADPASFGLTNPAELLDPAKGLTELLTLAQNPKSGPSERVNGELLDTVTYTVPGTAVPVLPDENPGQPVTLTVAVDPSSFQLRSVTLVGPFTSATSDSRYVVTLSNYGEHVTVTLPPTG